MPNLGPVSPQQAVNEDYLGRLTHAAGGTRAGSLSFHDFVLTGSASVDVDIVVADKIEVIDVIVRKDGTGTGNTIQIKNGTTAISDAIAAAVDKTVTRAGTIDTASNVVAAGGTLRCSAVRAAGTVVGLVTVVGIVRP